jgi:tetratricopeptide (TPR) repeat protein
MGAFPLTVLANLPSFYGETFARQGHQWPDATPRVKLVQRERGISRYDGLYERQIAEFESLQGPYANALAEPLFGLGRILASRGDYEQAVGLYRRALHIQRLNDGLYSELQAPIVRALLDSIRDMGDLKELDHRYDYFFRLYGSGRPPYTEIRKRSALEYLRWQREALRLKIDARDSKRLLRVYRLNETLLEARDIDRHERGEELWQLTVGQIRNLYLIVSRVTPAVVISSNGRQLHTMSVRDPEIDFDQRQLETIQRNALGRGTAILEQFISLESPGQARGMLELADWHQWNGSHRLARKYYTNVVTMLLNSGEDELLKTWFGEPVELPDNGAFWQPQKIDEDKTRVFATATYDVSPRGRAKNISVTTQREEDKNRAIKFRRELGKIRFRPRYDNGEAVASSTLQREYELYE